MQVEMVELSKYRMEKAKECLSDAIDAFEENRLANSVNRSYYAMFHATRALLAIDSFDSKKHSSIIGYFNQLYIANGKCDHSHYQMLANAFRVRERDRKIISQGYFCEAIQICSKYSLFD